MIIFYYVFYLFSVLNYVVLSEKMTPSTYQLMKYSHIRMELNYATNNDFIGRNYEFADLNTLVTLINSKSAVHVSGRLLVVKSDESNSKNGNSTKSYVDGACSRITTFSETRWIALVMKGGHCSLKEKLDNVLIGSNASAVIIMDNSLPRNGDKYEFNNKVGLLFNDQLNIILNDTFFINASIIVSTHFVDGLINRTSVLFVSISFILLMVISLIWLVFYYIQRFRYMHAKERLSRRLANAAKKALDKIPLKVLSTYDNEVSNDYDQCAICIDNYNVGETIRILPCRHRFHKMCIDSWLIEQRSCPMCKVDILKACGVYNFSGNEKTRDRMGVSIINQGILVSGATVTAAAALLEAGLGAEPLQIEAIGSNSNPRCRRGHSTFLQRYRERYGLYNCHRGHRRDHFHKMSRNFHEHTCTNHKSKSVLSKIDVHPIGNIYNGTQLEPERVDLISESEQSIISHQNTSIHVSIPEDKDSTYSPRTHSKQCELQEISNGLVYDICECSSDNTNAECDTCECHPNNSNQASTNCSCETCSDCLFSDTDCGHYNSRRNKASHNHGSGIGNLLTCCMASSTNLNPSQHDSSAGLYSCNPCIPCRSSTCSSCHNKETPLCKHCSSKAGHTKAGHCHFPSRTKSSQYCLANAPMVAARPTIQNRQSESNHFENVKRLKSMMLMKSFNKSGTMDSYTKSSISDDFDFEADNGSSSMEISVPAVKLTVLPPQVQCHQGPPNTDSSCSSEQTTEEDKYETPRKSKKDDVKNKDAEMRRYSDNSL